MLTNNEEILSQKFNNYDYAPGIATYGIDGKTGETGVDGNIIYYTDYDITDALGDDIYNLQALMQKININKVPISSSDIDTERPYKIGDFFIDRNGIIYKLIDIKSGTNYNWTEYFEICGKVNITDNWKCFEFPGNNNRLVLNPRYAGYDIISGVNPSDVSNYINEQAAVNIVSKIVDENNNIEMVRLQSIDEVDVEDGKLVVYYKTSDNTYYIESNKPVVINSDLKIDSSNNVNNEYDNYSTVLSSNDTITYFKYLCDKLKYDVVYDDSTNQYKLLIQQKNNGVDILNYLLQRNETVFGKIYTAENEEYLVKLGDIVLYEYSSDDVYYNHLPLYNIADLKPNMDAVDFTIKTLDENNIDFSTFAEMHINQINKSCSIDISTYCSTPRISAYLNSTLFGVNISYVSNFKECNANTPSSFTLSDNVINSKYYANAGIYKYVFNTNDIAAQNNFKVITLYVYPMIVNYDGNFPVTLDLTFPNDNSFNGEYALQFAINRSNDLFSISNITLQDSKNAINATYEDTSINSIQTYVPINVSSIAKFSLIHNTEVFINYEK